MAKPISGDKGRVKLRIVEFELEGNDSTLQESLRTISSAIHRATNVVPTKRVDALGASARPAPKNGNGHVSDVVEDVAGAADEEVSEDAVDVPQSSTQRRRVTTYPQPEALDIDFNAPAVTLKSFMDDKKPTGHNMKFLAVAAWFKAHGGIEAVSYHQIYSAYLAMDWRSRKNMVQPFYSLQSKNWMKQTDDGWTVTHTGVERVRDLPGGD